MGSQVFLERDIFIFMSLASFLAFLWGSKIGKLDLLGLRIQERTQFLK